MFRALALPIARSGIAVPCRAFHTPFAVLSSTASTATSSTQTAKGQATPAHYDKAYEFDSNTTSKSEDVSSGLRTYMVSPDAPHPAHAAASRSDVPSGAWSVATPYA